MGYLHRHEADNYNWERDDQAYGTNPPTLYLAEFQPQQFRLHQRQLRICGHLHKKWFTCSITKAVLSFIRIKKSPFITSYHLTKKQIWLLVSILPRRSFQLLIPEKQNTHERSWTSWSNIQAIIGTIQGIHVHMTSIQIPGMGYDILSVSKHSHVSMLMC